MRMQKLIQPYAYQHIYIKLGYGIHILSRKMSISRILDKIYLWKLLTCEYYLQTSRGNEQVVWKPYINWTQDLPINDYNNIAPTYMVGQVRIHYKYEIPGCMFNSVHIRRTKSEFLSSRPQQLNLNQSLQTNVFITPFVSITIWSSPYIFCNSSATSNVPSGLPSSMMIISNLRLLTKLQDYSENVNSTARDCQITHASDMYFTMSHTINGRFSLSL